MSVEQPFEEFEGVSSGAEADALPPYMVDMARSDVARRGEGNFSEMSLPRLAELVAGQPVRLDQPSSQSTLYFVTLAGIAMESRNIKDPNLMMPLLVAIVQVPEAMPIDVIRRLKSYVRGLIQKAEGSEESKRLSIILEELDEVQRIFTCFPGRGC